MSVKSFAQTENYTLDFDKFVIKFDTICNAENKGCYPKLGMIIITNDSIEYNGVKYFMTHKNATFEDGIQFCATSIKSDLHKIVVSGNYLVTGFVKMTCSFLS